MVLVQGGSYQGKGHTHHGGQTEANLDSFSEVLGPVHIQAENQRPQDPKHNEESPAKACKFLEGKRRSGAPHHCDSVTSGPQEEALTFKTHAITKKLMAG